MDDIKARKQVVAKSKEHAQEIEPLWTLAVLDEAAERGLVNDLPERLTTLEHQTPFFVGEKARQVIEGMKQRDLQRKQTQEQDRKLGEQAAPTQQPTPEQKLGRSFGRGM